MVKYKKNGDYELVTNFHALTTTLLLVHRGKFIQKSKSRARSEERN